MPAWHLTRVNCISLAGCRTKACFVQQIRSLRFCSNHIDCAWASLTAFVSLPRRLQQTVCSDTPMLQSARAQLLFSFCQAREAPRASMNFNRVIPNKYGRRPPARLDNLASGGFMILPNLHAIFCLPKPEALTRRPRHRRSAQR